MSNLSIYARSIHGSGTARPFAILGVGAYRVASSWKPGLQAGLGLDVPLTASVSLITGATAHWADDLHWIDAYFGAIFRLP